MQLLRSWDLFDFWVHSGKFVCSCVYAAMLYLKKVLEVTEMLSVFRERMTECLQEGLQSSLLH